MLGTVLVSQSKGTKVGRDGLKELRSHYDHCTPLSLANLCLLLSFLMQFPQNLLTYKKWYRPNLQAGRYKISAYPKSFRSKSNRSWTAEASLLLGVIREHLYRGKEGKSIR